MLGPFRIPSLPRRSLAGEAGPQTGRARGGKEGRPRELTFRLLPPLSSLFPIRDQIPLPSLHLRRRMEVRRSLRSFIKRTRPSLKLCEHNSFLLLRQARAQQHELTLLPSPSLPSSTAPRTLRLPRRHLPHPSNSSRTRRARFQNSSQACFRRQVRVASLSSLSFLFPSLTQLTILPLPLQPHLNQPLPPFPSPPRSRHLPLPNLLRPRETSTLPSDHAAHQTSPPFLRGTRWRKG